MSLVAEIALREAALAHPIVTARGTWAARRGALLAIRHPDGRIGRGEATPLPGYSPDDPDDCARALAAIVPALDPASERVDPRCDDALAGLPAARFALETALADLAAQRAGVSVGAWLAGAPVTRAIPRSGLVDLASDALTDEARALVARDVRTIKAKIGACPLAEDLAALARLRDAVGDGVALRLDANGAFDLAGARAALAALAPLAPELVEEPTGGTALLDLGACAVPWAADESLQDARIAARLLDSPCVAFVIKPALFGLHAARALAIRAQRAGKKVIVTHLFDGPIALAAACELALSLPEPPLACGLDVHASIALFGSMRIPQLDRGGVIVSYTGPGLGVA